jgi:hypothetical protein
LCLSPAGCQNGLFAIAVQRAAEYLPLLTPWSDSNNNSVTTPGNSLATHSYHHRSYALPKSVSRSNLIRIMNKSERQKHVDTMKAKIDEWSNDIDEIEKS